MAALQHAAAPALRNSCHGCAFSKLKCSQEKPTCSRCAKRGVACEYVVAKRGGRKPKNRLNDRESSQPAVAMIENTQASSSPATWFASTSSTVTSYQNGRRTSDILYDIFNPLCESPSATGLDDFFTTPSFSTEISDTNFFETADFFSSIPSGSFPASEDATSDPSSISGHSSLFGIETHNAHGDGRPTALIPSCSCLVQALGFMKQLSAPIASDTCFACSPQGLDKTTVIPSIQAIIAQNEATIESLSTMLRCSCSEDGYLLTITSLIVFKVLSWYAIVARKTSSLQNSSADDCPHQPPPSWEQQQQQQQQQVLPNPTVVGKYCLDGADSERMKAQLILSELHRVRRLVNQLSVKLKMQGLKNERVGRGAVETTPERICLQQEMTLPLSTTMYNQLDVDLKKQLRTLSSGIIDRLRRL